MRTAKNHLVALPCAYARQRKCQELAWVCLGSSLPCGENGCARQRSAVAVRAGGRAHGKEVSVAVRAGGGRTAKLLARQMVAAHGNVTRTAETGGSRRSIRRTAKPLPCIFLEAHGKESFAGQVFAVRYLPCVDARQRLGRAYISLCRAISPHGKASVSRSALFFPSMHNHVLLLTMNCFRTQLKPNVTSCLSGCRFDIAP